MRGSSVTQTALRLSDDRLPNSASRSKEWGAFATAERIERDAQASTVAQVAPTPARKRLKLKAAGDLRFCADIREKLMLKRISVRASVALLLVLLCLPMISPLLAAQSAKPSTPDNHSTSRLATEATRGDYK